MDDFEDKVWRAYDEANKEYRTRWLISNDAILLSDAFATFIDSLFGDLDALDSEVEVAENSGDAAKFDYLLSIRGQYQLKASHLFRDALTNGALVASISDPDTGIIDLPSAGWKLLTGYESISAHFTYDFVAPDDSENPGPLEATLNDVRRPVFFRGEMFSRWHKERFGHRPLKKRGRPRGSGSYIEDDLPLLTQMRELLQSKQAKTLHAAARAVHASAVGKNTQPESKLLRLMRGYEKRFGRP